MDITIGHTKQCANCQGPFGGGVAYLSAGALLLDETEANSIHTDKLRAFLHFGFHGSAIDASDSADVCVVDDLPGGQFDISFCSLSCLRDWLNELVDGIEHRLRRS